MPNWTQEPLWWAVCRHTRINHELVPRPESTVRWHTTLKREPVRKPSPWNHTKKNHIGNRLETILHRNHHKKITKQTTNKKQNTSLQTNASQQPPPDCCNYKPIANNQQNSATTKQLHPQFQQPLISLYSVQSWWPNMLHCGLAI